MSVEKKPLNKLFRDNPGTREGKYLVKRRDGSIVEWPHFVLGARDENAENALRFYALLTLLPPDGRQKMMEYVRSAIAHGLQSLEAENTGFARSVLDNADLWAEYRQEHGEGDPLMGPHRKDDPATIAEMRKGMSA